jgi:hypothetical protein
MDDERLVVIGAEMAAALDAEARRQASGPPSSPLPSDRYRPEHLRLLDPQPSTLDESIAAFAREYRLLPPGERASLREAIGTDDAYTLLAFARRSAVFALRARQVGRVEDGLAACAAIGYERVDDRDGLVAIALLHHAAGRCDADPSRVLGAAATMGEAAFATLVDGFLARPDPGRDLRGAWGHVEVEGPNGIGLLRWGFRRWAPTRDLVGASLRVAEALRGDDYQIDDPELAVEIPAIWLSGSGDPGLTGTLAAVRGAAVVQGRLRPDAGSDADGQQLSAWVAELSDPTSAERLVRLSKTPWSGTATVAVSQGPHLALVIARAIVEGVPAHEHGERLARFAGPLAQALAG